VIIGPMFNPINNIRCELTVFAHLKQSTIYDEVLQSHMKMEIDILPINAASRL